MGRYFDLFTSFLRIGAFTFGGGYSMLPLMRKELVERRGWATEDEIAEIFALSQVTPGAIATNAALFVGYRQAGLAGGIFAVLGEVLPSIVIIVIIAASLSGFADVPAVVHAFVGIRVAVAALIVDALIRMVKGIPGHPAYVAIALASLVASAAFSASPVLVVLCAAVAGAFIRTKATKR